MPINSRTPRLLLTHFAAWLGFAVYEQSVFLVVGNSTFNFWQVVLLYVLNAGLFYSNSEMLFRWYARRRYLLYGVGLLTVLALYTLLRCYLYIDLFPSQTDPSMPTIESYKHFSILALYRGTFFVVTGLGYWFARHAIGLEKHKREQEHLLRETERSLMESNLAFLKNQINPHFLFNSLNFLYAQVYPHSEDAARGILLLSETMRYALHEETNGKVMLAHEVKHLNNYIEINQLRFNNQLQIDFQVVGNIQFLMILPLVLITFVENCFKHGELADAANPLTIRLEVVQNQLTFYTHNKKRHGPKEKSTGIGLANTRRRLELLYQGRYELTLADDPDDYTCTLTILL